MLTPNLLTVVRFGDCPDVSCAGHRFSQTLKLEHHPHSAGACQQGAGHATMGQSRQLVEAEVWPGVFPLCKQLLVGVRNSAHYHRYHIHSKKALMAGLCSGTPRSVGSLATCSLERARNWIKALLQVDSSWNSSDKYDCLHPGGNSCCHTNCGIFCPLPTLLFECLFSVCA
jgi:hypothetical protein